MMGGTTAIGSATRYGRRTGFILALLTLHSAAPAAAQNLPEARSASEDAESAVREVLVEAYVSGIHIARDPDAVRRGFHPDFVMMVHDDGQLVPVSLQSWLDRMELDRVRTSETIHHVFRSIDVTGDAAMAILEIYENGTHIYTDYFSLYRFPDGWRIVSKIFHGHD